MYFLSVFLCCFCLCAIFFYGPCCLNKINDDEDDEGATRGFSATPSCTFAQCTHDYNSGIVDRSLKLSLSGIQITGV